MSHSKTIQVAFFNVGDGACVVIKNHEHHVWVVDCGSRKLPVNALQFQEKRMKAEDLTHAILDWIKLSPDRITRDCIPESLNLVITHNDADHFVYIGNIAAGCMQVDKKNLFVSVFDNADFYRQHGKGFKRIDDSFKACKIHELDRTAYNNNKINTMLEVFDWNGERWNQKKKTPPVHFLGVYLGPPGDENDNSLVVKFDLEKLMGNFFIHFWLYLICNQM